jgi:hypothetical protein
MTAIIGSTLGIALGPVGFIGGALGGKIYGWVTGKIFI